jgi:glucose/arabinose dehydrogenase
MVVSMAKRIWGMPTVLVALTSSLLAQSSTGAIHDPIPAGLAPAAFGLVLKEVVSFPSSEPVPPPVDQRLVRRARINYLGEIPDGTHRLYVPDLNGLLNVIQGRSPQVYVDVKTVVGASFLSGRGLGSGFGFVAFHPQFRTNGKFYTVHTEAVDTPTVKVPDLTPQPKTIVHGVVTEWTARTPSAKVFEGERRELLRIGFASYVHGIQQIAFNPTARPGDADYGLLYIAVGDGGTGVSTNDPQNLAIPQGKLLRIDPQGINSANGKYGIPPANPFVGNTGALGEIYAYGMRDPHRFSWDPGGTHRLFLAHIGERDIEAIYDVRAGDNLGWSEREGPFVYNKADRCDLYPLPADDAKYGYTYPVAAYGHNPPAGYPCDADVGHAVSGGFVYRGNAVQALRGKYLFADLVDGRLMYTEESEMRRGQPLATIHELMVVDESGRDVTMATLVGDKRVDLRFGRDGAGELYVLSKANGKVWKVVGTRVGGAAR